MAKKTPKGSYDVGYGKPPKHTQFAKGQSGNPSGGGKKKLDLNKIVLEEALSEVTVTENGAQRRVTKLQLAFMALLAKAAKGDVRAYQVAVKHYNDAERLSVKPIEVFDWTEELEEAHALLQAATSKKEED